MGGHLPGGIKPADPQGCRCRGLVGQERWSWRPALLCSPLPLTLAVAFSLQPGQSPAHPRPQGGACGRPRPAPGACVLLRPLSVGTCHKGKALGCRPTMKWGPHQVHWGAAWTEQGTQEVHLALQRKCGVRMHPERVRHPCCMPAGVVVAVLSVRIWNKTPFWRVGSVAHLGDKFPGRASYTRSQERSLRGWSGCRELGRSPRWAGRPALGWSEEGAGRGQAGGRFLIWGVGRAENSPEGALRR